DGTVFTLDGDPYQKIIPNRQIAPLKDVKLLAPCLPTKIIAVGLNYADHAAELKGELPQEPIIFFKPPSSVIGPGEWIRMPPQSNQVDYEAELTVIIGRQGRRIPPESAPDYILGYTCGNDVTARDLQRSDRLWTRAKGFDTFCVLGPWIETELDTTSLQVISKLNGEIRQQGNTDKMVFDVPALVAYISGVMTLEPGDAIMTGTPAGIGPMADGDMIEISVEGIGTLSNPVTAG
ncbi:MAG: fumarylacetoacetate hydrolase family protein, partial [Anaerolineales bacterium]|nr:fumarylacetoacetate hydrolase family protein [Anaerolineales bacterium]